MENQLPQTKPKPDFLGTKIIASLLPALVFTQNWGWMSGNKILGAAFVVFWVLLILNVWGVQDKSRVLHSLFRATEVGFFLLPISALVLTFVIGSQAINSTSGMAQAGAAIGIGLAGMVAVSIGFVVGLFGGIIMHLLANKYGRKIKSETQTESSSTKGKANLVEKYKTAITVVAFIVLIIVAANIGEKDENTAKSDNYSNGGATQSGTQAPATVTPVRPREPSPLEVVKTSVTSDSIGTPVANVTVKNVSKKTVDAFKVNIKTFNSFGEPANGFLSDNSFNGIAQDEKLTPGATTKDSWKLYNYDTTNKIEASVYQVHFTDDTTWEK